MAEEEGKYITRSIRARESTLDAFKELSRQFGNQADLLDALIEFYKSKELSVGRETEMANFEAHLKAILETYAYALTLANDAELRIASQYADQLESKDDMIRDLQQKNKLLEDQVSDMKNAKKELMTKVIALENVIQEAEKKERQFSARLADKDKVIAGLEEKVNDNNAMIATLVQEAETQKKALAELERIRSERDQLQDDLATAQKQQKDTVRDHEHQLERLKSVYEMKMTEMQHDQETALQQAEIRQEKALLEMQSSAYSESKRYLEEINILKEEIMQLKLSLATADEENVSGSDPIM